jgi:hypothetical protein
MLLYPPSSPPSPTTTHPPHTLCFATFTVYSLGTARTLRWWRQVAGSSCVLHFEYSLLDWCRHVERAGLRRVLMCGCVGNQTHDARKEEGCIPFLMFVCVLLRAKLGDCIGLRDDNGPCICVALCTLHPVSIKLSCLAHVDVVHRED